MTTKFSLLTRAAALTGIIAFAALPALAQTTQPAAPAPGMTAEKPADQAGQKEKGDVAGKAHSHAAKHDMKTDKSGAHEQTAQAPGAAKKADEPAKTDADKKL